VDGQGGYDGVGGGMRILTHGRGRVRGVGIEEGER